MNKKEKLNYTIKKLDKIYPKVSIPLDHALKYYNREDIIVYAIDPSKYKCDYIQKIADINDIKNIKVIHYGLADKDNIEYTYISQPLEKNGTINSGGTNWGKKEELNNNKEEIIQFIKLDTLIQNNIIQNRKFFADLFHK